MNRTADDNARRDVDVHVRLVDPWSGAAIERDVSLSDVEPTERGLVVGPSCFPWHRVISYEWEVHTDASASHGRPQLHVRLVYDDAGSPREYVVAADGFEAGPWTAAAMLPDRVEPEAGRAVYRRLTVPWARVVEYERQIVGLPQARLVSVPEPDLSRMNSTSAATGV
jgi:hypothetical protein